MKFLMLWSGLCCHTVKCSQILVTMKLLYNPWVNKVFTSLHLNASHSFHEDCLKDLHASILRKLLASTPHGPPAPLVLKAASLIISPLICKYTASGISSSIGPNKIEPSLADCGSGCFSFNCFMTSSVRDKTPPLVDSFRNRSAALKLTPL